MRCLNLCGKIPIASRAMLLTWTQFPVHAIRAL
ncbi:hypothetical protein WJX75_004684 [Coccomyxa subellipsoidea]|uniref:Uncharacterized protein n=1 Tax=Coccomyxa subellipsoidea TaxID=248742 RepID=A0ABR2YTM5_9CHLO